MNSKLDFLDVDEYNFDLFEKVLIRYGLLEKLLAAKYVGIKPNLCAGSIFTFESGVVVNKDLLERTCAYIRQINSSCRLAILESDSTGNGFAYLKFETQRYDELIRLYDVELVDLSRTRQEIFKLKRPKFFKNGICLSAEFHKIDFLVSFAKIKTHNVTTISCCLKNLFGCLPDSNKSVYHPYLSSVLTDINCVIRPDLFICEGSPALEGNGPVMGVPKDMGVMVMSNDPVASDVFIAKLIGFKPSKIEHVCVAGKSGIGELDFSKTDVQGYENEVYEFKFVGGQQIFLLKLGLFLQKVGQQIAQIGHLLHQQKSLVQILKGVIKRLFRQIHDVLDHR